mgnify:FL=1
MKRILITNDDGAMAPGLSRLLKVLCPLARVTVVAPAHNQSAASSALTLDRALCVSREGTDFYTVDGTPADCVHVALTGLLAEKPDLIVAGINRGKNLGEDIVYSGTLGAARAGYLFGVPSLAVSLVSDMWDNLPTAAFVSERLVFALLHVPALPVVLFNVNVPDVPIQELRGIKETRPGLRDIPSRAAVQPTVDGKLLIHLGPQGQPVDCRAGTDFEAIASGYVSVSPLKMSPVNADIGIDFSVLMSRSKEK